MWENGPDLTGGVGVSHRLCRGVPTVHKDVDIVQWARLRKTAVKKTSIQSPGGVVVQHAQIGLGHWLVAVDVELPACFDNRLKLLGVTHDCRIRQAVCDGRCDLEFTDHREVGEPAKA